MMILDIKKLKKQADLLNGEGTILGLYYTGSDLYLGSYLIDGSGTVYYSTTRELLKKYLTSQIRLRQLYLASEDVLVTRAGRNDTVLYLKEDMQDLIFCGEKLYSEHSPGMKDTHFEETFLSC